MPLKAVVGTAEKEAVRAEITIANVKKRVARIEAWNGSAWKLVQSFAPPISLSMVPSSAAGSRNMAAIVVITTNSVTATVSGGAGPYSYNWVQIGGPAATIYTPSNATTNFGMALGPGDSEQAEFRCTVTDTNDLTAQATVTATFTNTSGA